MTLQPQQPQQTPAPGYYPVPGGPGWVDWWDGQAWAGRPVPAQQQQPQVVVVQGAGGPVAVRGHVSGLTTGQHIFHGIVTVLTGGLWLPVWVWLAVMGRRAIR